MIYSSMSYGFFRSAKQKGYIFSGYGTSRSQDCDEYNPDVWTSKTDIPSPGRNSAAASTV